MSLVTTFVALLQPLAPVFTAPSFESLLLLLPGWVFAKRRTVTRMLLASTGLQHKHFSSFHRLFAQASWSLDELGFALFGLLRAWLGKLVLLTLDDTLALKTGKKVFGAGMHHDPSRSTRQVAQLSYGHSWVVLAVVIRFPFASRGGALPPAPEGWTSWAQVRSAKETLTKSRWLVLARKERLQETECKLLAEALALPCAGPLRVVHEFAQAWYAIWESAPGERRSREDAHEHYVALREHAQARVLPALARIQRQMKDERFAKLSVYLSRPGWEGTNNGAEREGRLFRHLQAPHYRMRTKAAIETLLKARAVEKMEAGATPPCQVGRSRRGRPPKRPALPAAA